MSLRRCWKPTKNSRMRFSTNRTMNRTATSSEDGEHNGKGQLPINKPLGDAQISVLFDDKTKWRMGYRTAATLAMLEHITFVHEGKLRSSRPYYRAPRLNGTRHARRRVSPTLPRRRQQSHHRLGKECLTRLTKSLPNLQIECAQMLSSQWRQEIVS